MVKSKLQTKDEKLSIPKKRKKVSKITIKKTKYGFIDHFKINKGLSNIAKDFRLKLLKDFPTEKDDHFFTHLYEYRTESFSDAFHTYTQLYEFLDINSRKVLYLKFYAHRIDNPDTNRTKEKFKECFDRIIKFIEKTDKEMMEKLKLLHEIECYRLAEAMKCLNHNCNLAAVVMAVSAVEHRLHKLLERKNKTLYKAKFERGTLGSIIELFRKDTRYSDRKYDTFKKILPEKHNHLMEILNVYRIFSAHPKDEFISHQTAKSILAFSFLLLIDEKLSL